MKLFYNYNSVSELDKAFKGRLEEIKNLGFYEDLIPEQFLSEKGEALFRKVNFHYMWTIWMLMYPGVRESHTLKINNEIISLNDEVDELIKLYIEILSFTGGKISIDIKSLSRLFHGESAPGDVMACIHGLKVVAPNAASWEQILEFRKDRESRAAFKRFRLFCEENYKGQNLGIIKDDLDVRIYDYEAALEKHGFETVSGAVNSVICSPVSHGSLLGSVAAFAAGMPLTALTAAVPFAAKIGSATIDIIQSKHSLATLKMNHPISYLSDARERLEVR